MSMDLTEARLQLQQAAGFVVRSGVMSLTQHGNFSHRVPGTDTFLLTPGGSFLDMAPEAPALVSIEGEVLDRGSLDQTTADVIQMHAVIYRNRPQVGGVLHTHALHATTFACAGRPIEMVYEAMARQGLRDGIPLASFAARGSRESVDNIEVVLNRFQDTKAMLLENHGLLTWGTDAMDAARSHLVAEESATIAYRAEAIGGAKRVPGTEPVAAG